MKTHKQPLTASCLKGFPPDLLACAGAAFQLAILIFLFPGCAESQTAGAESEFVSAPWVGIWTIADDQQGNRATNPSQKGTVEIRPTTDGKGLEISRKASNQPDVQEVLVPDGTRRPVNAQNCSGWQSARLVPEAGLIIGSSEMSCKDTGSFATSSLKMITATDTMVDILALKTAGQTRLAVRHLMYERDLTSTGDSQTGWAAVAARTALSAPWNLSTIIHLSRTIDTQLVQATLVEKKARLTLTPSSLKEMKTAKLPKEIIDLLVALAFPDEFHIQKNGNVELRPWLVSSSGSSSSPSYAPGSRIYYPGAFYNCYSPYGYYSAFPFTGLLSTGACLSYYSPFWWDYPIYIPFTAGGTTGGGAQVSASQGYVQIEPREGTRHARPREGFVPFSGTASSQGQPGVYGSGAASSSGGAWSGGGSAAPSASPGGYSSGGSGGGTAVPR